MRNYILGIPLDSFSLEDIEEKISNNQRIFQVFVNVHKIVLFHKNSKLKSLLEEKDAIFSADGRWVQFFTRAKGLPCTPRFGGLEVIENFFSLAEKQSLRIYLLGAKPEILEKAKNILELKFPYATIAGFKDGFFSDTQVIIEDIQNKVPNILFLALPSPQKELLGFRLFKEINSLKYVAGVGGAFDLIAGTAKRAPWWVQTIGMEWFYRCLHQPRRLAKRYFFDAIDLMRILMRPAFFQAEGAEKMLGRITPEQSERGNEI